jgi:glycosyltransferase involved in cell wall biosynthesis
MEQVSILLPVFNGAAFLEPLLGSVLSQTWKNFELLVLDDGSTDNSWDIITKFAQDDSRIRAQRSAINRGQERALEELSEESRAPLIMFCDQDDVWDLDKVRHLFEAIGEYSMVYGLSQLIDANGRSLNRSLFDLVGRPIEGIDCLELLFRNTVSGHALLMKRANLSRHAFAPSKANILFDWRLAAVATYANGLKFVSTATTWHRIHATNRNNRRASALNNTKKVRQTHLMPLYRMSDVAGFLADHPSIASSKRAVFAALVDELENYSARSSKWHVVDTGLCRRITDLAKALNPDTRVLDRFNRNIARIARGWLNPAFWWREMRAAGNA